MAGAAAIMLAGEGMKVVGNLYSGFAQASALDLNAKISERNARQVELDTAEVVARFRRQAKKQAGSRHSARGASGITLDGSAFDVMLDSAVEEELQAATITHQGKIEAMNLRLSAQIDKEQARVTRIGALFGAAGSAASGYGKGKATGVIS